VVCRERGGNDFTPLTLEDEQVKQEIVNLFRCAAKVLQKVEIRPSRFDQCDDLAVNESVVRQIAEGFVYQRKLPGEGLLTPRKQKQIAARIHGLCSIAVPFDFPNPLGAFGQVGYRKALHWFDESNGLHSKSRCCMVSGDFLTLRFFPISGKPFSPQSWMNFEMVAGPWP